MATMTATRTSIPIPPIRKPSMKDLMEDDEGELHELQQQWIPPVCKTSSSRTVVSSNTATTADETDCSSSDGAYGPMDRRVRFGVAVKKHLVESHRCYTKEEKASCWYTAADKEKRNTAMEKVIARMDAGKMEKRSRPFRGLEGWTIKGSQELETQIMRTLNAVMDEQDAQWEADITDEVRIAAISRNVTAVSLEKALHIACLDEQAAISAMAGSFDESDWADDQSASSMASTVAKKKSESRRRKKKEQLMSVRSKRQGRKRTEQEQNKPAPQVLPPPPPPASPSREGDPPGDKVNGCPPKLLKKVSKVKSPKASGKKSPKSSEKKSPKPSEKKSPKPSEKKSPKPSEKKSPKPSEKKSPKPSEKKSPKPSDKKSPKPPSKKSLSSGSSVISSKSTSSKKSQKSPKKPSSRKQLDRDS